MKFQQRLAMLSSAGGVTVLYLLMVYSQGYVHQAWDAAPVRYKRSLYFNSQFEQSFWNTVDLGQNECSIIEDSAHNATVSTLDLPAQTNYQVYTNREYSLPHPPPKQAYGNDVEPLNVYVIPYSHVDAGWLRTVDEYYTYHVKNILNNMVKRLGMYENMTFVWSETVFLSMWWNELDDDVKLKVRRLITKGKLEIASGGWVMPDEASTHYVSVIDQLAEGHQWVQEHLHTRPVNSWSIDPFGHSGTMPYLWKQSGMENMVVQRVHQAIKGTLAKEKRLEFLWRQYWDRSGSADILCHVMPYLFYGAHYTCGPDQNICAMYDFGTSKHELEPKSHGEIITSKNIATQAKYLYEQYRLKSGLFKYNTILVPLGDDFRFDEEKEWELQYENYIKLMEYMNSRDDWKINVQFGTLTDYFNSVRKDEIKKSIWGSTHAFPSLSGDFFPYSDRNLDYWTGYYTTRPYDKQLSRDVESSLRAADILNVLARAYCKEQGTSYQSYHDVVSLLQMARRNLALFLHHDAITGTAKPLVVQDYEKKLMQAYNATQTVIRIATQTLLTEGKLDSPNLLSMETIRTGSTSPPAHNTIAVREKGTSVILFNPVAQKRVEFVRVMVDTHTIDVKNSRQENIPFQINPIFSSATTIHSTEFEIVFLAEIPPFGIETYTFYKVEEPQRSLWSKVSLCNSEGVSVGPALDFEIEVTCGDGTSQVHLENGFIRADFDADTGMLQTIVDKHAGNSTRVQLQFLSYMSQGGGAYLFYPSGEAKEVLDIKPTIRIIRGPFLESIEVVYENLHHVMRLYDVPTVQGQGIHVENTLDLNEVDMRNNEFIMRLKTDIDNKNSIFYTDQNGYQLIGRQTDPTGRPETNYYPITTMALLEDNWKRLTLHSAQSHGAASLKRGELEVMLDRQVLHDDERGLGEGVWDNKPTVSRFILQLEYQTTASQAAETRYTYPSLAGVVQNDFLQQPLQKLFTPMPTKWMGPRFQPVNQSLPCDVSVVSLKNLVNSDLIYNGTSLLLHRKGYQCKFPAVGLQCSTTNGALHLRSQFPQLANNNVRETTLTHLVTKETHIEKKKIHLNPMEIKAYQINL